MSRSRRTLSCMLIFIYLNNGLVSCQVSPGVLPIPTETCSNFKGLTLQPTNLKPDLLSAAQRLLAGSQRLNLQDCNAQPMITKPPLVTIGPSYQQVPVNVNPAPNLAIPLTQTPCNAASVVSTSEMLPIEIAETFPLPPVAKAFEYPCVLDHTYIPLTPVSFCEVSPTCSFPEVTYLENFIQQPELLPFYPSLVNEPTVCVPTNTPFTNFGTQFPNIISPNLFAGDRELVTLIYPYTNCQQTAVSTITQTIPIECESGCPKPLHLQIDVPCPRSDQPIILLSSPSSGPSVQDASYVSPMTPMGPPLIMKGRSRSRWKTLLPILLIALCDGGCCKNSGKCGCSGGSNTPIPYPIPIPTNNPIINSGSSKKKR